MKPISEPKSSLQQAFNQWFKSNEGQSLIQVCANGLHDSFHNAAYCHFSQLVARAFRAGAQAQRRIIVETISLN
jgi:hypothetical protein